MEIKKTDFLVIGSGIAGLWFAYRTSQQGKVLILTKKKDTDANTNYAQGGIAAVMDKEDDVKYHIDDTLKTGDGICHKDAVEYMVKNGPQLVEELYRIGIDFTVEEERLSLTKEGGHSHRRIVHSADRTGAAIEEGLLNVVRSNKNVEIDENSYVVDFIVNATTPYNQDIVGVLTYDREKESFFIIQAKIVFLATGGLSYIFEHTTNPPIATGDGVAMAFRAGVRLANLEFVQFHPTSLYKFLVNGRSFLISEAVRGEGGKLRTIDGYRFMPDYHPQAELATRDIVARAIFNELKKRNDEYVLLDLSDIPSEDIKKKFPLIYKTVLSFGIDITKSMIPVVPAAHYSVGGVLTDLTGKTSMTHLYAAGEVSCTGVHGANRLASNSLLEALVFSDAASKNVDIEQISLRPLPSKINFPEEIIYISDNTYIEIYIKKLRWIMWYYAGIVRDGETLKKGINEMEKLKKEIYALYPEEVFHVRLKELRNMLTVGTLILKAALAREESRGLQYRKDFMQKSDSFKKDTIIERREHEIYIH